MKSVNTFPAIVKVDYLQVVESIFEYNISPMAIMDRSFNFIRVNKAYAEADKRDPLFFVGINHFQLYPSEENEQIFRKTIETKKPSSFCAKPFEYFYNPERGTTYWDWLLSPVLDRDGEVILLILSLYNATPRIEAMEELNRFFHLSPDILCILDYEGRILKTNNACEKTIGYNTQELQKKRLSELVHWEDLEATVQKIEECIAEGKPVIQFGNRLICKDNSCRWLEWTAVADTTKKLMYAVARDITEKKEMSKKMLQLERLNLLGNMAAAVGHEIRNPLTTVRGFLQLLSKNSDTEKNMYYELMIEELDRANSIITEYLSIGRDKASDMKLMNLNELIESLLPLMQADAICMNKNVVAYLQKCQDLLLSDKEIRQLILNLVRNGLEAITEGGIVTVHTYMNSDKVVLAVKDTGPGIPRQHLDKLGTPFFTTKEKGTGLGLATCYSIANKHNAVITVDSNCKGTTFYVSFSI